MTKRESETKDIPAVENVMQPRSKSVPSSLRRAAQTTSDQHPRTCNEDSLLVLGEYNSFIPDLEEEDRYDIWVQDGQVLLFVKCPGSQHERLSRGLSKTIFKSLEESLGFSEILESLGSANQPVVNLLGCHARFEKQPDDSIAPINKGGQKYPVIVLEVASNHESLHILYCEAAAWLNKHTDVKFCFLAKIWPSATTHRRLKLMLLSRETQEDEPEESSTSDSESDDEDGKKYCLPCDAIDPDDEQVESTYHVKVVYSKTFDGEISSEEYIEIDLHELLKDTVYPLSLLSNRYCKIPLRQFLSIFYSSYKPELTIMI